MVEDILVHSRNDTMKTFSSLKRDIRTLYRPKSKGKKQDEGQGLGDGIAEAPCDGPSIQLEPVPTTPARPDETQKLADTDSHIDSAEDAFAKAQAATDDKEQDTSGSTSSPIPEVPKADSISTSAVEEAQANEEDDRFAVSELEDQDFDLEDGEPLDSEEPQSLQDQLYIQFLAEEPEDFTEGPARIIASHDGVKPCAALLMPYDLSQKIQAALQRHHEFARLELEGLFRKQSLSRLEDNVHREIASCKARLCRLEDAGQIETEDGQRLVQQLSNLQLMLPDIGERKQKASVDVDMHAKQLRRRQAAVNTHLEEAFIHANLIAPHEEMPEPEIEKLDVSQEYLESCQRLEGPDDYVFEDVVVPLDNNRGYPEVPTEEEQARQAVINSLWAAKEALDLAHKDFDDRENDRAREYEINVQAADRGEDTTDDSPEAFDIRWVVRFRDLTRALIEAEAVYADVKRMAFEAGVPLPFTDNESLCEGVGDDTGYTISKEQELMASTPSPTVRKWLSKVPEGGETGSVGDDAQLEADEWDAEEVGISDSVSLVAEGRQRSRIDRWQNACLAEKSQ
ncbi:hypothetical protein Q7P36_005511 [Cladosporium allicinum]